MCGSGGVLNPTVQVSDAQKALGLGTNKTLANLANPLYAYGVAAPRDASAATAAAAQDAEKARQAQITAAMDKVDSIFGSPDRTAQYGKYKTDTFNVLKDSLDQNQQNASRKLNFGLIRTGNLGGSEDITQHGLLQQDYSKGLLDASNKAQGAEAQLEGQDQALKSNIDNLILNGMSATQATQQAMAGLQSNIQSAQETVAPATFDSVFGDLASAYLDDAANKGAAAGNSSGLGSYFQAPTAAQPAPITSIYDPNYLSYGGGQ